MSKEAAIRSAPYRPFRLLKRGDRKEMVLQRGDAAEHKQTGDALVKALAQAFHSRRMMESVDYCRACQVQPWRLSSPPPVSLQHRHNLPDHKRYQRSRSRTGRC